MIQLGSLKRRIGIVLCVAMLALGLIAPTGAVEARRVTCATYDQAEFFLLTGIDSYYGGTLCVR